MSSKNAFGELVSVKRRELNLSQRELAHKIGKSSTYINYVERGYNPSSKNNDFKPSVEAVDDIAKVLKLDINEARLAAGYAPATEQKQSRFAHLMRAADNLPPERREMAYKQVEALLRTYYDKDFDFDYIDDDFHE